MSAIRLSSFDEHDVTPELFEAAKYGAVSNAKLALQNGADVAARDEDGSTPLHVAARALEVVITASTPRR